MSGHVEWLGMGLVVSQRYRQHISCTWSTTTSQQRSRGPRTTGNIFHSGKVDQGSALSLRSGFIEAPRNPNSALRLVLRPGLKARRRANAP